MSEDGTSFIQKVVNAELNSSFDHPAQGAVVVIRYVVHEERVVETFLVS